MTMPTPLRLTTGSLEIFVLNDGVFQLDGGSVFGRVPKTLWERFVTPDHNNCLELALNSLFVVAGGKRILIETGYGEKLDAKMQQVFGLRRPQGTLLDQLAALGIAPEDIDIVLTTHLHGDHAGWNTRFADPASPDRIIPTFPNARYIVQQTEWHDAVHPSILTAPGYPAHNLLPLQEAAVLDMVDGETPVTSTIRLVMTPGHTAGHQSIWIEDEGESLLFTGDVAINHLHLERINWVGAVDNFPITTVETRQRLVERVLRAHTTIVITHETFPGVGTLVQADGESRPRFIPYG